MIQKTSVLALLLSFAALASSMSTGARAKQAAVSYVEVLDGTNYTDTIAA